MALEGGRLRPSAPAAAPARAHPQGIPHAFATSLPLDLEHFARPSRQHGVLPFWFLNGELDPEEMRRQLRELRAQGMAGVILHARYGLEMDYLGERYLAACRLAVEEAAGLGLDTWIYDEMNWPSGTAGGKVLEARPELAERYLECVSLHVAGPWFQYLTGGDDRYLPFGHRSQPLACFAIPDDGGAAIDLTPRLCFRDVVPWQVPEGGFTVCYLLEKTAPHYIDALDPEATDEFIRLGYAPYLGAIGARAGESVLGFYTDEPAMYYHLSAQDEAKLPWTRDMLARFAQRNGYDLRPELPKLFFELEGAARVRRDFHRTLTELYADGFYRRLGDWCRGRGLLFTGHLLYEESPRKLIRTEGNPFTHYRQMDVIGVDHLYPLVGSRDLPDQNVALKLASSAAHQLGSERVLCESFGGLGIDATLQRLRWIADWQFALGVDLINPHGYHYTLEGPRKRDWPPSMFYQEPWWQHYGRFADYVARVSATLAGGEHVCQVALLWPLESLRATYRPQERGPLETRIEDDFTRLSELLLRIHHDYDVLDEDVLAELGGVEDGMLAVGGGRYRVLVLPPLTHLQERTLATLERFVAGGGSLVATTFLPETAFAQDGGEIGIAARVRALFGLEPGETRREHGSCEEPALHEQAHAGGGRCLFLAVSALRGEDGEARLLRAALDRLVEPSVTCSNEALLCLQRRKDGRLVSFVCNPTWKTQRTQITLPGRGQPLLWDALEGTERPLTPAWPLRGRTAFTLELPPAASALVLLGDEPSAWITGGNVEIERIDAYGLGGLATGEAYVAISDGDATQRLSLPGRPVPSDIELDGEWSFDAVGGNACVLDSIEAAPEREHGAPPTEGWRPVQPGIYRHQAPPAEAVWYRTRFTCAAEPPAALALLVDGFAAVEYGVFCNGRRIGSPERRSRLDCQMRELDLGARVRPGPNRLELRLLLDDPDGGLLDPPRLIGAFALDEQEGLPLLAPLPHAVSAAPWDVQGFPHFSGEGVYRRSFTLAAEALEGMRVFCDPDVGDDVCEVVINGVSAGVRPWGPYRTEITKLVRPGANELELRITNTLGNLLDRPRRSGLLGPARILFRRPFELPLAAERAA